VGQENISIDLSVDSHLEWTLNGRVIPEVSGCKDLDLNFSPSTNLIPIRRLNLGIGQSAQVNAAWLRFPELTLESLDQVYMRSGPNAYHYESADGAFSAELTTNPFGLVTVYPNLWAEETQRT